jgi:hypothetical protein
VAARVLGVRAAVWSTMGRLMAATVATNDQGQIPLVERPQGLLGQRELLLLLHACLLSLPRPVRSQGRRLGQERGAGKSPPRASGRRTLPTHAVALSVEPILRGRGRSNGHRQGPTRRPHVHALQRSSAVGCSCRRVQEHLPLSRRPAPQPGLRGAHLAAPLRRVVPDRGDCWRELRSPTLGHLHAGARVSQARKERRKPWRMRCWATLDDAVIHESVGLACS